MNSFLLAPNAAVRESRENGCPALRRAGRYPATHDYLSIAVEFDNRQDIIYYWSAELPPETSYRCPISTWAHRGTHVVLRSGQQGLGEWFNEDRNLYQDYINAIGGTVPGNIIK
ncbi:MAG: DUF3047 domain-containing protein [Methylobacter sp.]